MGQTTSAFTACMCGQKFLSINGNRYYHKKQLGEGGFSYVDLVEDGASGDKRALKRIICHDDLSVKQALEEINYCKKLKAKHIIGIIEDCVKRKVNTTEVWIVMPFYKKGTLFDEYQRRTESNDYFKTCSIPHGIPPYKYDEYLVHDQYNKMNVLRIFYGICEGLLFIHSEGLAHRDLKPANILISDNEDPVIMDFGSMAPAKVEISNSKEAMALQDLAAERCTLPFRAPELFNVPFPTVIDEKIDIWSLGCILYSLMHLEGPFDKVWLKGDSVALAVQNNNIKFNDRHPALVQDLCKKLLHTDPSKRPDIDEVITEIRTVRMFLVSSVHAYSWDWDWNF